LEGVLPESAVAYPPQVNLAVGRIKLNRYATILLITSEIESNMMNIKTIEVAFPRTINESSELYRAKISIGHTKTCNCKPNHLNRMTAKEWIKSQLGVWQFNYEGRDIRDKNLHPATFPLSLANIVIWSSH